MESTYWGRSGLFARLRESVSLPPPIFAVLCRMPALFHLAYVLLLAYLPSQFAFILSNAFSSLAYAAICFAVLAAYAGIHLILIRRIHFIHWVDVVLAGLPGWAFAIALWRIEGLQVAPVLGLIVTSLALGVTPRAGHRVASISSIWITAGWAALYLVLFVACFQYEIEFPRLLGASLIFILAIGQLFIGLTLLFIRPWLGAGIAAAVAAVILFSSPNQHDLTIVQASDDRPLTSEGTFIDWLKLRGDLEDYRTAKRPYPVILVASEGGGIYAAAHAFSALTSFSEHCPSFAQHIYGAVGVSGGSFGNLLFAESISRTASNGRLQPCRASDAKPVMSAFEIDHFSPVLARLLFVEFFDFLLPGQHVQRDRAVVLAESFKRATLSDSLMGKSLTASWQPSSAIPMLIFASTDVMNGQRLVFSAAAETRFAQSFPSQQLRSDRDVSVLEAATTSARFPWVTPTARLDLADNQIRVLADGGYFENSGAETALDVIQAIKAVVRRQEIDERFGNVPAGEDAGCRLYLETEFSTEPEWKGCDLHVFFAFFGISTDNGQVPGAIYDDAIDATPSFFLDPVRTMLSTRSARGNLALNRARSTFCRDMSCVTAIDVNNGFFIHWLPMELTDLPLGWHMSTAAAQAIASIGSPMDECEFMLAKGLSSASRADEAPAPGGDATDVEQEVVEVEAGSEEKDWLSVAKHNNGCEGAIFASLFNPALDPKGYGLLGVDP